MGLVLGIFIGESFAELTLVDAKTKEKIDFQRWYLPRFSLKNYLSKYLAEKSITKLDSAYVTHRYLEKLFTFRVGGSVAQLITLGFEKTLNLEEKLISNSTLWPQKPPSVSSAELVFSINEKVDSSGRVTKKVDLKELESISAKLKMMDIKKICLHLYNSNQNDENLKTAKAYLETEGFDLFIPESGPLELQFQHWRKNLIEAALTGTFLEMQEEIKSGLASALDEKQIHYLDSDLNWFQNEKNKRIGSLVALENLWMKMFPGLFKLNDTFDIFHFGLENFSLIQSQIANWEIAWGKIPLQSYNRKDFQIQPTQSLKLNDNNELVIDKKELSFEPGPVTMGRGIIPCIYDILNFSQELATDLQDKLKRSLQALLRNSQRSTSTELALGSIRKNILDILAANIEFTKSKNSKQVVVYGYVADKIEKDLKSHPYFSNLTYIKESSWPKSYLTVLWGIQTTNDK